MSKISQGKLVLIVGPSGSGKDTLINWLRDKLSHDRRFLFVRRTVTRTADVRSEAHDTLSEREFEAADRSGKFAVTWNAHGLRYGIPIGVLAHTIGGGIAIANGSRRALQDVQSVFPDMVVINLRVERHVLAQRLAQRGRETAEEIKKRLERMDTQIPDSIEAISLDNSTSVKDCGEAFLRIVQTDWHASLIAS